MSNQKFFDTVFAASGDLSTIPDAAQGDGSLSYAEGYGFNYQRDPATDPAAKRLNRQQFNQLVHDIVANLQEYQLAGFPEWTTSAQNGGTPVAYPLNAYVRREVGGTGLWVVFCSLVANNTADPATDGGVHWAVSAPLTIAGILASQTQVNQGDSASDAKVVGPIELVRAAREGRWTYAGAVTYATTQNLTAVFPADGVYSQVAGLTAAFTVPTTNTAGTLTFKLGTNAAAPLRSSTGNELQAGDLTVGGIYTARFNGTEWRMTSPVASELQQYGASGSGSLYGLIMSNAAGALNTAISVAVGACRDSTNAQNINLAASVTKRVDQAWTAGTGNGGRDAGAIAANQTWHTFVILNPTTGIVDVLFSQSATAPVLPSGYTLFRRIGAFMLDASSNIRQFVQAGDWFKLKVRSTDYATQANGGGPFLRKITVPNGVKVEAEIYFQSTGTADTYLSGIYDPDEGIPAAFGGGSQWAQIRRIGVKDITGANASYGTAMVRQFTDTAQNIYTYSNDPADVIAIGVTGWRDDRGRFF